MWLQISHLITLSHTLYLPAQSRQEDLQGWFIPKRAKGHHFYSWLHSETWVKSLYLHIPASQLQREGNICSSLKPEWQPSTGALSRASSAFRILMGGGEFCGWMVFSRFSRFCVQMGRCHLQVTALNYSSSEWCLGSNQVWVKPWVLKVGISLNFSYKLEISSSLKNCPPCMWGRKGWRHIVKLTAILVMHQLVMVQKVTSPSPISKLNKTMTLPIIKSLGKATIFSVAISFPHFCFPVHLLRLIAQKGDLASCWREQPC